MKRTFHTLIVGALAISGLFVPLVAKAMTNVAPKPIASPFHYQFRIDGTLKETGSMGESTSPYFWLNSGAYLILEGGVGKTYHGALSLSNIWRLLYLDSNARDTENGYYPQNLFRLVTKHTWSDFTEEMRFRIDKVNMTDSPERDGWSGILFFSRYHDGNNLYYVGLRMDGKAVIKKKFEGSYTTLAEAKVFNGTYNRLTNPNLIPAHVWMRMKTRTVTNSDGSVTITLYLDKTDSGTYAQVLSITDKSNTIKGPGYAGIRTDYMDVSFDDYKLTEL